MEVSNQQFLDFVPYNLTFGDFTLINEEDKRSTFAIDGMLTLDQIPSEVWMAGENRSLIIVIPKMEVSSYHWFATPVHVNAWQKYVDELFMETFPHANSDDTQNRFSAQTTNLQEDAQINASVRMALNIFIYGFASLLMAIAFTNIVSTISANIHARTKEFAILQSIGMDQKGMSRMLNYESIFYSVKALGIGLPLGFLTSYAIYMIVRVEGWKFAYRPPFIPAIVASLVVFFVTWLLTRYSVHKMRKLNIIETIRGNI
ncbi:MAG: ABC transporter permease [Streptococcaceae bacterium]|jgi:putative ABC transport system permease protein|nr:ABC transporter permease [Streptococcaceae bacterium]